MLTWPPPSQDDNDDYCASCGGNGELLCCDGCTRSFHLLCLDPPLPKDSMPQEWFCNVCRCARSLAMPLFRGPFALLLDKLEAQNSSAFRLPDDVRSRFEGVTTGVDGEYEEAVAPAKPGRYVAAPRLPSLPGPSGPACCMHLLTALAGRERTTRTTSPTSSGFAMSRAMLPFAISATSRARQTGPSSLAASALCTGTWTAWILHLPTPQC